MDKWSSCNLKAIVCERLDYDLKKRLIKTLTWSVLLHGYETWTLQGWKHLNCSYDERWKRSSERTRRSLQKYFVW